MTEQIVYTKTYVSVTVEGDDQIKGVPHQAVVLRVKKKPENKKEDILEIEFPAPKIRKIVQIVANPKFTAIFWSEDTESIVLYINDRRQNYSCPKIFSREEFGKSRWQGASFGPSMGGQVEGLLSITTYRYQNFLVVGLHCPLPAGTTGTKSTNKDLKKHLGHAKWQNVGTYCLERACRELLVPTKMKFDCVSVNLRDLQSYLFSTFLGPSELAFAPGNVNRASALEQQKYSEGRGN
ncbi:hypothetical protein TWF694_002266 [Orbilia ellipsospora]|uniref:Uncharacterized protein n=1 Tax=Orbilia ellipsospora TaxID=2528407 RepID=A0AAV9X1U0_9PEZI